MSAMAQYSFVGCSAIVVSTCDKEHTYLDACPFLCSLLFRSLGVLAGLGQMLVRYIGPQALLLRASKQIKNDLRDHC